MSEPGRARNPWGQGDRLRAEILDAAGGLIGRLGGADAVTIRGVARAVGIAPASIYQHFADRAALLQGLAEHHSARLVAVMAAADEGDDPVRRLRARLRAYVHFAVENPGHYRLVLTGRGSPLRDVVRSLLEAVESCEQAGVRLRLPAERAAVMLFVSAHGRVALLHAEPEPGDLQRTLVFLDEVLDLVLATGDDEK